MKELVITRTFNASREKIWDAFTKPEHLNQWWGPKGAEIKTKTLELKPGGIFHYFMNMPDGEPIWGKFIYGDIEAPEKLDFINCFSDENGGVTRNPWNAKWPLEVMNHMTLDEENGKTTLTLKGGPINATKEEIEEFEKGMAGMNEGFKGSFDVLEEYLASSIK